MKKISAFLVICIGITLAQDSWQSNIVYYDDNDILQYARDTEGNSIPDFSYAGYRNGNEPIPEVEVVKTIQPISGDNTQHIENALFEVALMPLDENGLRGALLLEAGIYEIHETINLSFNGVILRGVGDGADSTQNTILLATGNTPNQRSVVVAGGGGTSRWVDNVFGSFEDIISDTVFVGERSFALEDASGFAVGDNIIINHPCTNLWLVSIDYGGTHTGEGDATEDDIEWQVGEQPIVYNRYITNIEGNIITIDAPVFNHLIRSLSQAYIYKLNDFRIRKNIGIENLRVDIQTSGVLTENHAWNAINLFEVEDAWVRNCTALHFGRSGFRTNTASRVTIENCNAIDPHSLIEGGRRYNFNVYEASQLVLFKDCFASNGRHHYMSNGMSWTSGVVFWNCTSQGAYAASEGHRRWSQGLLYDNHVELDGPRPGVNPRLIGLYNRGYYGTSHGWSAAHSVTWNCDVANGEIHIQKPPGAQNYSIGSFGTITGERPPNGFDESEGYIEGTNMPGIYPSSLFEAQLLERLNNPPVSVKTFNRIVPFEIELAQNYPNPFNPSTTITFKVANNGFVKLNIFNTAGMHVFKLLEKNVSAGTHSIKWNTLSTPGSAIASGLYIAHLEFEGYSLQRKMLLLK